MTTHSTPAHKKRLSGRIARGVMSIFLPVQETTWFLRSARHMTARNLARMRDAFPEPADSGAAPPASPDWKRPWLTQAVRQPSWRKTISHCAGAGACFSG